MTNGYSYGQVSEKTRRVKILVDAMGVLGNQAQVDIKDVLNLLNEIRSNYQDIDDVFVDAARKILEGIAEDGHVDEDERALLKGISITFSEPISKSPVEAVTGKKFVLTGDFDIAGGKATVKRMIEAGGGKALGSVSKKTDYVVVGNQGSDAWAFGNFGNKIKSALEIQLTGKGPVKVVSEVALLSFFEQDESNVINVLREQEDRFSKQWESAKVVSKNFNGLTSGQQQAFDLAKEGHNIFLTGLGGTGKSFVLNKIIEWAMEAGKNTVVCAPTGIAALNVGGSTIHRVLGIRPGVTLKAGTVPWIPKESPLPACDLMIVDEISMCRLDLFDYLSASLRRAAIMRKEVGKKPSQLIVVGDFCQLPPVVTKEERPLLEQKYHREIGAGYPFAGDEWDSWDFARVELVEAIRQRDAEFVAALNACRVGDTSGLRWIEEHAAPQEPRDGITLCGRNNEAERENKRRLDALASPSFTYYGEKSGEVEPGDLPTSTMLELKAGARVMVLVNFSEDTCMNGSLGTVSSCEEDSVSVLFDTGKEIKLEPYRWEITKPIFEDGKTKLSTVGTFTQIPLKLAYAITIHKSQGQTFDAVSIHPECWDPGQLYTALSRVSDITGLHLKYRCQDSFLVTSPDVIRFNEGTWTKPTSSHLTKTDADKPNGRSLESIGISPSSGLKVLQRAGISNIDQIISMTESDLKSIKGMGPGKINNLMNKLEEYKMIQEEQR